VPEYRIGKVADKHRQPKGNESAYHNFKQRLQSGLHGDQAFLALAVV
jgi:hypothetical protein